ncbi:alpha/beta hydrolase [Qipengyuania soli]|uniref:Alpha/beta hydrolase n=1 Tax=Qipengyuania soli TaxID=2782568 RepID=A0A7S8F368_9SPHN|nr:alpha/beta hydrolase [Qipengyuania soli]QPC98334.1 alpha/beta hydrolase [Qipengyuania soli]
MLRIASLVCSVFGLALAAPASAQSLSIMTVPVVLAAQPLAQLAVEDARRIGVVRDTAGADFTNLRFAIPGRSEFAPVPATARPAVDRSFRDYRRGIARFGPFLVLDSRRVALVDETGHDTPAVFAAMRRAFPDLVQVDMVECPGTRDDKANMELGRMIRAAHMVTHVPPIGSVRSGAVELFLAGVERDIADGAEFAVHSWMDEYGREAGDFGENAPENLKYISYYREMGMGERQARAFYAFTNSVPHAEALWLEAQDMRRWAAPAPAQAVVEPPAQQAPKLAYSDMTFS